MKTFRQFFEFMEAQNGLPETEPIEDYTHVGHDNKPGCPTALWYWGGSGGLFVYDVPEGKQAFHGERETAKFGDPDYLFRQAHKIYLWSGRFDKCKKAISAAPRNQHIGMRFPESLAKDLYKQFGSDNRIYQTDWNGGGMKPLGEW